jgi:hypothetical protein
LISTLPSPVFFGRFNFYSGNSGTTTIYNPLGRGQSNNFTNTYELAGSMTKIVGQHTLRGGLDIRQINYLQQNTGDILRFDSYTGPTSRLWNQPDTVSGDPYATFLLGIPQGDSNYPLFPWWKQWFYAPYVQDDWKVSRRLTLNLGLRIDFNGPVGEKWNRMNGPFDPSVATTVTGPGGPLTLRGGFTFAGVNGIPDRPMKFDKNNWQPRAGAAYQISDKLVMRGGIGLYYSNPPNDMFRTNGFSTNTELVNSQDDRRTFIANTLSNPFPNGIQLPTGASLGALTFVGKNSNWFDSNFNTPKVWSFQFGFQYQVTPTSTLDFAYVGTRSLDLSSERNYNLVPLSLRQACNPFEGGVGSYCDQAVTNPFKGISAFLGTNFYTANTISRFAANRLHPQFDGNLLQQGLNTSKMFYNAFQVTYNFRVRGGINLLGNYTLSKQVEKWGYTDPYNNIQQQGLYYLDRPHVLKLTTIYELPFGKGKRWATGVTGFADKLVSGWEATMFFVDPLKGFPSNLPGNVLQLRDPMTAAGWSGETDWKAHQVRLWSPCVLRQFADGHVEPMPYSRNAGCGTDYSNYVWLWTYAGSPGNGPGYQPRYTPERSGQVRRHHAIQMDASILKNVNFTERLKAQFGIEAFNVMNHNYFGRDQIITDPNNTNFGSIFPSTVSTQNILPRQIQIRMKVMW